jgi:hypothetical protein
LCEPFADRHGRGEDVPPVHGAFVKRDSGRRYDQHTEEHDCEPANDCPELSTGTDPHDRVRAKIERQRRDDEYVAVNRHATTETDDEVSPGTIRFIKEESKRDQQKRDSRGVGMIP